MFHKTFPTFEYNKNNFVHCINKNEAPESEFDLLLKEKWQQALKDNIFRYKVNVEKWKFIVGEYKFLAQLNINRAENRREPEEISSMSQPFNPNRFHFNKISDKEIIFDIDSGDGNNVIAVNVSPIETYHCLVLPQRFENLPQVMTERSIQKVLEIMMISSSIDLRAAFNSLGAYASVNHLHWHLYYLQHRMPLENITLQNFNNGPVQLLENYPAKGFCIKLSSVKDKSVSSLSSWVFLIVSYLQNNDIAHNVYITRANSDSLEDLFDDLRVYIWARKHSYGIKNIKAFFPAVCELFGHLLIRNEEEYDLLTEKQVSGLLKDATEESFYLVKDQITKIIGDKLSMESQNN